MSYNNVTSIDMLSELEDINIENNGVYTGASMLPPSEVDKFGRYIRGSHKMPEESGMSRGVGKRMGTPESIEHRVSIQERNDHDYEPHHLNRVGEPNCMDFAHHHGSCPICSKFYNNDKTAYILAIIILSLVCILLLKRVLDV